MKQEPLKDYSVGVLHGFLIGHHAPPVVMAAFERIRNTYFSQAGEFIGEPESPKAAPMPEPPASVKPSAFTKVLETFTEDAPAVSPPVKQAHVKFSEEEDDIIRRVVRGNPEAKAAQVRAHLKHRGYASIHQRMEFLKRNGKL